MGNLKKFGTFLKEGLGTFANYQASLIGLPDLVDQSKFQNKAFTKISDVVDKTVPSLTSTAMNIVASGSGSALSALSNPINNSIAQNNDNVEPMLALGGNIIQDYSGGNSHAENGLKVDKLGNPVANSGLKGIAEVEGGEYSHDGYVFSNKLKFNDKLTFAEQFKALAKKYNYNFKDKKFKRDSDPITRKEFSKLANSLKTKQETLKAQLLPNQEQQISNALPKAAFGLDLNNYIPPTGELDFKDYFDPLIPQISDKVTPLLPRNLKVNNITPDKIPLRSLGKSEVEPLIPKDNFINLPEININNKPKNTTDLYYNVNDLSTKDDLTTDNLDEKDILSNNKRYLLSSMPTEAKIGAGLQLGTSLANSIIALSQKPKEYKPNNYIPEEISLAAQREAIASDANLLRNINAKNASRTGNISSALNNLRVGNIGIQRQAGNSLDQSFLQEETSNINANNQARLANIQEQNKAKLLNNQESDAITSLKMGALANIGNSAGNISRDLLSYKAQQDKLKMLGSNNFKYIKSLGRSLPLNTKFTTEKGLPVYWDEDTQLYYDFNGNSYDEKDLIEAK